MGRRELVVLARVEIQRNMATLVLLRFFSAQTKNDSPMPSPRPGQLPSHLKNYYHWRFRAARQIIQLAYSRRSKSSILYRFKMSCAVSTNSNRKAKLGPMSRASHAHGFLSENVSWICSDCAVVSRAFGCPALRASAFIRYFEPAYGNGNKSR
jgi:hypothetical protein